MEWFYIKGGERVGPVQAEAIKALITDGTLTADDVVWNKTMGEKWCKLSDVYIFAVNFQKRDPHGDAEFGKRLAQKRYNEAREKAADTIRISVGVILAIAMIGFWIFWKQGEDVRLRGMNDKFPLGKVTSHEAILIGTYKMDKREADRFEFLNTPTLPGTTFSNPRAGLEEHVNGNGQITLYANGDRVETIYAGFASTGQRGPLWLDKSILSIQTSTIWGLLGGPLDDKRKMIFIRDAPAGIAQKYGLTKFPPEGTYCTFDTPTVSGIWVEHSQYCALSMVLIKLK